MPHIDPLAFDIVLALTHKAGGRTKMLIRSLSQRELDFLAATVAEHRRLCRWRPLPPDAPAWGDQYPAR